LAAPTDISWARSRQAIRALFKRDMRFPPRRVVGLYPGRASFVPRSATGGSPLCLLRVRHDEGGLPHYDGYDWEQSESTCWGTAISVFRQLRPGVSESWRVPLRQASNRYPAVPGGFSRLIGVSFEARLRVGVADELADVIGGRARDDVPRCAGLND